MPDGPIPILCLGIVLEIVLGLILLRTGRGWALIAMGLVAVATLAAIGIERLIVTDAKRVKATLEHARAAVEANDIKLALDYFDPQAAKLREWAKQVPGRVRFTEVKIKDLQVTIDGKSDPPRAEAKFFGWATFESSEIPFRNYAAELTVEIRPIGGRWLITRVLKEEKPFGAEKSNLPTEEDQRRAGF
jgi:hypothetical protein